MSNTTLLHDSPSSPRPVCLTGLSGVCKTTLVLVELEGQLVAGARTWHNVEAIIMTVLGLIEVGDRRGTRTVGYRNQNLREGGREGGAWRQSGATVGIALGGGCGPQKHGLGGKFPVVKGHTAAA